MGKLFSYYGQKLSDSRTIAVLSFSFFYGWFWCFAFEGKVFYAIAQGQCTSNEIHHMALLALVLQFVGLFISGFFIKNKNKARKTMLGGIVICIYATLVFQLPFSIFWYISLAIMSLLAGLIVGGWGFWIRTESTRKKRIYMAAEILILSNIFEIIINAITINASRQIGLLLCISLLILSMFFTFRLNSGVKKTGTKTGAEAPETIPVKPVIVLYLFMMIITINWGLMYTITFYAFDHIAGFSSWYWCIPYLVAVFVMRQLANKTNRYSIIFVVVAMSGFSFILYGVLDNSLLSYIIINTLMLGSYGLCDLFSWTVLGEILDYVKNPAKIFGVGLSANTLGIILGKTAGEQIVRFADNDFTTTIIAITVGFIVITILPILYNQLSVLLADYEDPLDLNEIGSQVAEKQKQFLLSNNITERELEIIDKIMSGKTYKMISEELCLSINTVKFHIKNIYSKLNVHNRPELIKTLELHMKEEIKRINGK